MAGINRYHIGLKHFMEDTKGWKTKARWNELKDEIKRAFQRGWNGADSLDLMEGHVRFRARMLMTLEYMKKVHDTDFFVPHTTSHFYDLGVGDDFSDGRYFSSEETEAILETMIWHLKMMDEEYCTEVLKTNYPLWNPNSAKFCLLVDTIKKQNKELFMKLFNMFYYQLWD